ncbi:MAG: ferrous iron transport protein A [Kiritimatiellaeota bacterium]|nr:ferrous iron transport protein A [Kiritimatiellota bacterium]
MNLLSCEPGVPHRIAALQGGPGFRARLYNLGIAKGQIVTKVHTHAFRGPVTLQVGQSQVALGRGMAARIRVEALQ